MLLHVLGHVELDQGGFVAEQELGEGLGGLGLPHPRRSQEDEGTGGPFGILEPGPGPANRLGDRHDGVVLADDALVQLVLHVEQLGGLLLGEPVHRDAGPLGEHLGDLLLVDDPVGGHAGFPHLPIPL